MGAREASAWKRQGSASRALIVDVNSCESGKDVVGAEK
jgi:hypothetical protein